MWKHLLKEDERVNERVTLLGPAKVGKEQGAEIEFLIISERENGVNLSRKQKIRGDVSGATKNNKKAGINPKERTKIGSEREAQRRAKKEKRGIQGTNARPEGLLERGRIVSKGGGTRGGGYDLVSQKRERKTSVDRGEGIVTPKHRLP